MANETGFDMNGYKHELDQIAASVMPSHKPVHGRIAIQERGFGGQKRTFTERLFTRLTEKHPDKSSEKLAKAAMEKADEKF